MCNPNPIPCGNPNRKQTKQLPLYGRTLQRSNVLVSIYWYMALENNDRLNKMSKKSNISQNCLLILYHLESLWLLQVIETHDRTEIHLLHQS